MASGIYSLTPLVGLDGAGASTLLGVVVYFIIIFLGCRR
jgi:hypothetical protein